MEKDKFISIRIKEELKKLLEQDAKEQNRSISNLLLWCWKQWRGSKNK